ncbi:trigger factor [Hydrogenophilus hirschii]
MEDQNVQNLEPNTEAAPAAEAAANPLERKVTLRIPAERIANETQRLIKQYARSVKMPGFRPGKVPLKLVERMYGSEARSEALSKAIEKALTEAIQQGEYRVAGGYRIDPVGDEPAAEGEFVVEAAFEIYPEIEIVDLKEVEVVKPVVTVDDAAVERTIEVLRKQRATFVEVDRPAEKGDRVTVDFVGTLDGEPFEGGSATDYVYVIGESRLLPEFDTAPVGLKAGEKKTFDVTFPENYGAEHLAGKTAQFELTVKKVEAPQLPEVDAEFAKSLGIEDGDVAKMRDEIRASLEREVKARIDSEVKRQVFDHLLAKHDFPVPQSLVASEAQTLAENAKRALQMRGMKVDNLPVDPKWFEEEAQRRVRLGLLIAEIVKQFELVAKPEQVRALIEEMAQNYDDPQALVKWYYENPQRLGNAEAVVIENNVVGWALERMTVKEEPRDFESFMNPNVAA